MPRTRSQAEHAMQYVLSLGQNEQCVQTPRSTTAPGLSAVRMLCRVTRYTFEGKVDLTVVSAEDRRDGPNPSLPSPLCRIEHLRSIKVTPLFRYWDAALHQLLHVLCGTDCEQDFAVMMELCLYPRTPDAWDRLAQHFQHGAGNVWTPQVHSWFAHRHGEVLSYDRTVQIYAPATLRRRLRGCARLQMVMQKPAFRPFLDSARATLSTFVQTDVSASKWPPHPCNWPTELPLLPHQLQTLQHMLQVEERGWLSMQHTVPVGSSFLLPALPVCPTQHSLNPLLTPMWQPTSRALWSTHGVKGGVIANEPGTGKSAVLLALAQTTRDRPAGAPPTLPLTRATLVVASINLLSQWTHEIAKFLPRAKVVCLTDQRKFKRCQLQDVQGADFVVTSPNFLSSQRYLQQLRQAIAAHAVDRGMVPLIEAMSLTELRCLNWGETCAVRCAPDATAVPLECLHWRRVVLDELHEYSKPLMPSLSCDHVWGLSASIHPRTMPSWMVPYFLRDVTPAQTLVGVPAATLLPSALVQSFAAAPLRPYLLHVRRVPPSLNEITLAASVGSDREALCVLTCINGSMLSSTNDEFVELRSVAQVAELLSGRIDGELRRQQAAVDGLQQLEQALAALTAGANPVVGMAQRTSARTRLTEATLVLESLQQRRDYLQSSLAALERGGECPVCLTSRSDAITSCGHLYCVACLKKLVARSASFPCPVCRATLCSSSVACVSRGVDNADRLGTKLQSLFAELRTILQKQESAVIFVQWTTLLKAIATLLTEHSIPFYQLRGNASARQKQLQTFQRDSGASVMLLSLESSNAGLDLTRANHVFFAHCIMVDAAHAQEIRRQAIARVHRLGQLRTVHVYDYLANETVEDELYRRHFGVFGV
jgi:superfamily II DNA or RNA helicase